MIIVCDLDGTLTDASGTISAANVRGLRRARDRGVTCVLATSRPSRCLDLPAEQRAVFDCIITCDGAELTAPAPTAIHLPLSASAVRRAERTLQDARITGAYAVEFGTGLGHDRGYTGWPATDTGVIARVGPLLELSRLAPVARIFFRPDREDDLLPAATCLAASAGDGAAVTVLRQPRAAGLVQLGSRSATKGAALLAWLAGARRTGRLVAFGDQLNDLSMLELADAAFAVGEAHPSLVERYTHLPNGDCAAVARMIEEFLICGL